MKVLVTGGTGFIGSHSVAALQREGHEVRLLVRSRSRIGPALEPLGIDAPVDAIEGDCVDPSVVGEALDDCDAVLHCANVYTWHVPSQAGLVAVNTATTENVLGLAVERGLSPIVHVSSYTALLPSTRPLDADSAVGSTSAGYAGSKASAERIARRYQDRDAPVVIAYPGLVIGPHDPHDGESNRIVATMMGSRMPGVMTGMVPVVDVRDVAEAHARLMRPGTPPRRVLVTGHDVTMADLARRAGRAAGHGSHPLALPPQAARLLGRVMDSFARRVPFRAPVTSGAVAVVVGYPGTEDDSARKLGIHYRDLDETVRDTVSWLQQRRAAHPGA